MKLNVSVLILALFSVGAQAEILNCKSLESSKTFIVDMDAKEFTVSERMESHALIDYDRNFGLLFNAKRWNSFSTTISGMEIKEINSERTDAVLDFDGEAPIKHRIEIYEHGQDIYIYEDSVREVISCK